MKHISVLLMLLLTVAVCAQSPERQERKPLTRSEPERVAKAQGLLNQARAALSQSQKFEAIQTLSASGKVRRAAIAMARSASEVGSVTMIGGDVDPTVLGVDSRKEYFAEGKVEYDFSLPTKFRWDDEVERHHRIGFLDGDRYWQKLTNNAPPPPPQAVPMIQRALQSQYAYITLGLLLTPPPGFPLEYLYNDEKPFRQTVADVIVITGPSTFKADLYLDQTTHLPLMLRFVVGAIARPAAVMMPHGTSRADGMRALEIAQQQAMAKPPGQQEREKLIFFEDYRVVDGVRFPHKIITQINGKLIEEISFSKFKLNQQINPEKFAEKK